MCFARAICFCFNLLGVYESTNRSRDLCQQFSSFVMILSLVYINLSGTDVLCWCVDELFRCVRDILTGGEIRASCVTQNQVRLEELWLGNNEGNVCVVA